MKRLFCWLMILALLCCGALSATTEEGDDSEIIPVDSVEEEEPDEDADDSEVVPVDFMEETEVDSRVQDARVLQYGDDGDDVLELQTKLKQLKYYTGNLSGRYREGTREAVRLFQKDYELEENGIADIQTQALIYTARFRALRYGSTGEAVKDLQTRLTALGYYQGKISGNYLEGTQKAVKTFQEKNHMDADGAADPETLSVLYSEKAIGRNDEPDPTATPAPNLTNYTVNDAENGAMMPEEPVTFSKQLKNGSSGSLVRQMQQRLCDLGYLAQSKVSGNFMKYTTRAVKAIQTQNGLKSNGIVDEETWNVIFNDAQVVLPDATAKPTPSPTPVPFAITVDVENQVTTVYGRDENGDYTVVVRQMLCSTGMKATPSDVGDWVLNGRHATWCVFPKWGNSYARYWTRINSSIAFHSVIYNSVSLTDMKASSYRKLGQRASHGCIRLTVNDAKWIYDNIGAGTVVSIVEHMPRDPELRDALKLPPLNSEKTGPINTPQPTAEPEYSAAAKPDLNGGTLKKGSESEKVYWVQMRLKELGFYTTKCTGKMLDRTVSAVKEFQKSRGIYPSGTVSQSLIDVMAEPAEEEIPMPEATPAPPEG